MDEPDLRQVDPIDTESPTAAPHPEEMKGTIRIAVGRASLTISGRATPAGLICAALLTCAVLIPITRALTSRR